MTGITPLLSAWCRFRLRSSSYCLALLSGLCLSGCDSSTNVFDPIGRWTSKEGYEVTLRSNGTYEFCDRSLCSEGRYERIGGPSGSAVTLVDFFKSENTARLVEELKKLYPGANHSLKFGDITGFGKGYDWQFQPNSAVAGASPSGFCDYKPCLLFGNQEAGPNLAIIKEGS